MKGKFIVALTLLLLLTATNTFAFDDKETLTAEQIIEKYIAAMGGKETLAKFKTRVATGTVKKDGDAPANFGIMSEAPNRVSMYYQFEKFDWRIIYNGSDSYFRPVLAASAFKQFAPVADKYSDMAKSGFLFNDISLYNVLNSDNLSNFTLKAKGTKKINNRETFVVEAKPKKGDTIKLFFDKETFMWVRTEFGEIRLSKPPGGFTNAIVNRSDEDIAVNFYFEVSDFKEVDGIKLPFKFVQVATVPILSQKTVGTITGTITEYKHNIPIQPEMFQ